TGAFPRAPLQDSPHNLFRPGSWGMAVAVARSCRATHPVARPDRLPGRQRACHGRMVRRVLAGEAATTASSSACCALGAVLSRPASAPAVVGPVASGQAGTRIGLLLKVDGEHGGNTPSW